MLGTYKEQTEISYSKKRKQKDAGIEDRESEIGIAILTEATYRKIYGEGA